MLAGSLVAVKALNDRAAGTATHEAAAPSRFGFRLVESAKALGVDFQHHAPTFDAQLEHVMPQIASVGASVAVADFDADGWQDFYVTDSGEGRLNRLYRNQGDGTFVDAASSLGVADLNRDGTGVSMGAV